MEISTADLRWCISGAYRKTRKRNGGVILQESTYKSYDELPMFLNAQMVAGILGVSQASAYELMHETGFPSLRIGNRLVVPKERFITWVDANLGKH